jgi:hypothetical protein
MKMKPLSLALLIAVALTGCDAVRSSNADGLPLYEVKLDGRAPIEQPSGQESRFSVQGFEITVPPTLQVSEANLFYPKADIVWRGEPIGNRLTQVQAILNDGLIAGVVGLKSGPNAKLNITLERFHALTEKARFSVGGVHDIVFLVTVVDAKSDAVLEGPRRVEIAIRASGNDAAIAEDAAGRTQRVVIVEGIAEAIRRQFTGPLSISSARKPGLFGGFR